TRRAPGDRLARTVVLRCRLPVAFFRSRMTESLTGKRIAFTGRLAGMTRREARALLTQRGAVPVAADNGEPVDWLVVGEDGLPLAELEPALDEQARAAARRGELQILTETQLWERLGLIEAQQNVHP